MISFHLDRVSPIPLYYQLQQQLREAIRTGRLPVNTALPTEPDLATQVGVSRFTLRQAVDQLVREGLLRRERGRGTFVAQPPGLPAETPGGFAFDLASQDSTPGAWILKFARSEPSPEVRGMLALDEQDRVVEIVRLRMDGNAAIALETIFLPEPLVAGIDQDDVHEGQLYDVVEQRSKRQVSHARQILRAVVLDDEMARQLAVEPGSAAFHVERLTYAGSTPIELRHTYVPSDRGSCQLSLSREEVLRDHHRS